MQAKPNTVARPTTTRQSHRWYKTPTQGRRTTRPADFMRSDFPRHRRRVLHRVVLFLVLLMGLEVLADAALRLGLV